MHYVTLFIEKEFITCCIVYIKQHKPVMIAKEVIAIDELTQNLSLMINRTIPEHKQKITCRVILTTELVLQRSLQLPNIHLMPYEIDAYVKNSLAKIFHTNDELGYDYIMQSNQPVSKQERHFMVYACRYDLINKYLANTSQLKLDFIGIPDPILQQGPMNITDSEIDSIACTFHLTGINFLPWREYDKRKARYYFLLVIVGYLLLFSLIAILLTYFATERLNQQDRQNQVVQTKYLQQTAQLSLLIDLDKHNQKLQFAINEQEILTKQFATILDYFTLITKGIPENVWLDSLEYQNDLIKLKGKSFLYADILLFVNQLNDSDLVKTSKIISIKRHSFLLQFHIDIRFVQNE